MKASDTPWVLQSSGPTIPWPDRLASRIGINAALVVLHLAHTYGLDTWTPNEIEDPDAEYESPWLAPGERPGLRVETIGKAFPWLSLETLRRILRDLDRQGIITRRKPPHWPFLCPTRQYLVRSRALDAMEPSGEAKQ